MTAFHIFLIILLFIIMTASLVSIIFGMPGTLISFLAVLIFVIITKAHYIGWITVGVLTVLTFIAELGETLFGIKDASRAGVSKKAITVSIITGIVGSIVLAPFLLGIGAILGAVLGTFTGAFVVSVLENKNTIDAVHKGWISAIGRLKGTLFKATIGLIMIIICLVEIL